MKFNIKLSEPHLTGKEQKYIFKAFDENCVSSHGSNLTAFEKALCNYTGAKACALLSSGTAAIHLALILLGVKENDEVLCTAFTFSATVNPIRYLKAIPVFVDSESDTWNMCPELLEEAIIDRIDKGTKPKAIVLVHLYGMPSKMNEIVAISKKYNIPLLEDAAEAIGASYNNKTLGTFGELGIFSFNGNKTITTSGGGALISNNPEDCKKAMFLAAQARDEAPHYQHSQIGYNYAMSNIAAGIGLAQLEVVNDRVLARRAVFEYYKNALDDLKKIHFLDEPKGFYSNRWLTTLITDSFEIRERVIIGLQNEKIESRPLWKPMHLQPVFKDFPKYISGVSEALFQRGLCLPSSSNLTKENLKTIVQIIRAAI